MVRGLTRDLLLQTCKLLVLRMYVFCVYWLQGWIYIRLVSFEVLSNVKLTAHFYCYGK